MVVDHVLVPAASDRLFFILGRHRAPGEWTGRRRGVLGRHAAVHGANSADHRKTDQNESDVEPTHSEPPHIWPLIGHELLSALPARGIFAWISSEHRKMVPIIVLLMGGGRCPTELVR